MDQAPPGRGPEGDGHATAPRPTLPRGPGDRPGTPAVTARGPAAVLNLTRWPAVIVFGLAGLSTVGFAFVTVNLFAQTMANVAFIERHGFEALRLGALRQLAELAAWGALALAAYLAFKACEVELIYRYFRWARRPGEAPDTRRDPRMRRKEPEER